jgi:hypothetical protein
MSMATFVEGLKQRAADSSGNYQVSVPGPPVFGSTWYRANFTGYALNATEYGGQAISIDKVDWLIQNASTGGRAMIPESMTDPIATSSVTNDAATVLAVVIVLIVIALAAMRRRKPSAPAPTKQ